MLINKLAPPWRFLDPPLFDHEVKELGLNLDVCFENAKIRGQSPTITFKEETTSGKARGPGPLRKIRQQEDWTQLWYDWVESEHNCSLRVWESREAAYVTHMYVRPCSVK